MTLIWQLMVGAGAILIIAGLEGISIPCTVQWIAAGASSSFPSGCTPSSVNGQINTTGTGRLISITTAP